MPVSAASTSSEITVFLREGAAEAGWLIERTGSFQAEWFDKSITHAACVFVNGTGIFLCNFDGMIKRQGQMHASTLAFILFLVCWFVHQPCQGGNIGFVGIIFLVHFPAVSFHGGQLFRMQDSMLQHLCQLIRVVVFVHKAVHALGDQPGGAGVLRYDGRLAEDQSLFWYNGSFCLIMMSAVWVVSVFLYCLVYCRSFCMEISLLRCRCFVNIILCSDRKLFIFNALRVAMLSAKQWFWAKNIKNSIYLTICWYTMTYIVSW